MENGTWINIDPTTLHHIEHICYYVQDDGETLKMFAVERRFYDQGTHLVCRIEETFVSECNRINPAPEIFLLLNQQKVTQKLVSQKEVVHIPSPPKDQQLPPLPPIRIFCEGPDLQFNLTDFGKHFVNKLLRKKL